jgi:hypothetical protein
MAFNFKVGKFGFRRLRLPQLGVRGNLLTAFAMIAGMAIIISVGQAWC